MRIGLVAPRYSPDCGALERHVEKLARAVVRSGGIAEVLVQTSDRRLPRVSEVDGVTVRRFSGSGIGLPFLTAPQLWEFLRRTASSYDIVHAHCDHAVLAVAAAQARARRLLLTLHSSAERLVEGRHGSAARLALAQATGVVCGSRTMAAGVVRVLPGLSGNVVVVPQGADVEAIQAAAPYATSDAVLLAIGRLERLRLTKGAIATLVDLEPSFSLVVVGDGPARHSLRAFAADLKVASRVNFVGRLRDAELYRWLRSARVVLRLSPEASGLTVLEAVAAGVPLVASDTDAHREAAAYVDSSSVTLVPLEASPLALADAIVHAARPDPQRPAQYSIPDADSTADTIVELYDAIIAGSGVRGVARALPALQPASSWQVNGGAQPNPLPL